MILTDTQENVQDGASSSGLADQRSVAGPSSPPSYAQHDFPAAFGGPVIPAASAAAGKTLTVPAIHLTGSSQSFDGQDVSGPSSYYPANNASATQIESSEPPLPSSFSRRPRLDLSYEIFQPIFLIAKGKTLDKGFPPTLPPSTAHVHPFESHDIAEEDWLTFLREAQTSATLTPKDVDRSYLPIVSVIPLVSPLAAYGVRKIMKGQKRHKVAKVIETWNHHFFEIRKVRVVLMRGKTLLSGSTKAPSSKAKSSSKMIALTENIKEASELWEDDVFRLLVLPI